MGLENNSLKGDWQYSLKPPKPQKQKPLIDRAWEVLGLIVKPIVPIVAVIYLYEFAFPYVVKFFPAEQQNARSVSSTLVPAASSRAAYYSVRVISTPNATEANQILASLRNMRVNQARVLNAEEGYSVVIENIISSSQANHIQKIMKSYGYGNAIVLKK